MTRSTEMAVRPAGSSWKRQLAPIGLSLWLLGVTSGLAAQELSQSPHGSLTFDCATCHRSDGWTPVRISRAFNHDKLGYPLAGAHASAACRACHASLDFTGVPTACSSCHTDVHRGELGADCSRCHTGRSFLDRSVMARAHQLTRFPLEGAHRAIDCTACHSPAAQGGQQFVARQTSCVGCHAADYASAREPDHSADGFPRECSECHGVTQWTRARFDHSAIRFPLTGAHRAIPCTQCHTQARFAGLAADCVGCHRQDYDQTSTPSHLQTGLSTDCATCHVTTSWTAFDHTRAGFPLTGAHRSASCAACHGDGVYRGKTADCAGCHLPDFNQATSPNHVQLGWPQTCLTCHSGSSNTSAWDTGVTLPSQYHTMFSVRHEGARGDCSQCHLTTNYTQSTCSTHHHPPSCTFLNRRGCDD
jgi:hypothetical protein